MSETSIIVGIVLVVIGVLSAIHGAILCYTTKVRTFIFLNNYCDAIIMIRAPISTMRR